MSLEVGQVLGGQYLIERVIGRGSMGLVYKGRETRTGDTVAVRLILPEFDNENLPAFFENDAKAVGQLKHENIARLYNIGFLPTGERCLVGEYVEGEILQQRIRRAGNVSELAVAQLLVQLLESLSSAHEAGVVHRDLTPSSIFVVPRTGAPDAIKVIDFGISRLQLLTANPEAAPATIVSQIQSFQYLSPEQLNGLREIDPRSNIYTLGIIAYEAMTGRLPFDGKDFADLTFNILQTDPPSVEELAPESSSPFSQLISKAMARSPNARFQYAEEMYAAISNWALRAGVPKSKLESGISDWRTNADVPVTSERSARASSPMAAPAPAVPSENETLPWGSVETREVPQTDSATSTEGGFRAKEPSGVDYFAHPSSPPIGLAEEDALFAPPPTAPRDELPFVALDQLTGESAPATAARPVNEPSPPIEESIAIPVVVDEPIASEPRPPEVVVEPKPIVPALATEREEEPPEEPQDPAFKRARTILGIGGVAVRPAMKSDPNQGVVVRGPDSVEPGVPPSIPSSPAPASAPYRPRLQTEPGITPPPTIAALQTQEPQAQVAPRDSAVATAAPAALAATAAPVVAKAAAVAAAVSPSPVGSAPQKTQEAERWTATKPSLPATKVAANAPKPAVAAAPPLRDDEIPVEFSRGRSKKFVVAAVLLIVFGAAGAALALLQKEPEAKRTERSPGAASSSVAVPSVVPSFAAPVEAAVPSASAVAKSESTTASSAGDAARSARKSSAPVPAAPSARNTMLSPPKTPKPSKPVQVTQPSTPAAPAKPTVSKGSVSKDPYNYR